MSSSAPDPTPPGSPPTDSPAERATLAEFVRQLSRRDGLPSAHAAEKGILARLESSPAARLRPAQTQTLTDRASRALTKALSGKPLTPGEARTLRVIVLPALRPVFDIADESFAPLPSPWESLNQQRSRLEPLIRGVGRISLVGHPSTRFAGTGFVCGPSCILTNRHVAQIFVEGIRTGGKLYFQPGVSSTLSLWQEVASSRQLELTITAPLTVLTSWDIAALSVAPLPPSVAPLPLAATAPSALNGVDAAIIGYPAYDSSESLTEQQTIFRNVFDKKRLQPGKLNGRAPVQSFAATVNALSHDCSTLGGNSGSALVGIDIATVVGIHFAGQTHVANYAVPTWELAHEPALQPLQLNFV